MKAPLPRALLTIIFAISGGAILPGQPFNPFNVQQPIDTSGPNGQHQEIHPSGGLSGETRRVTLTHELGGENHGGALVININAPKYLTAYFPELGNEVRSLSSFSAKPSTPLTPPEEAAPFLGEPFYPHLTALLTSNKLPSSWSRRLNEFAAKRDQAAERVLHKVEALKSLPAAEAATTWAEFTANEAKVLTKLERERQAWLDRLQNGGWNNDGVTWENIQGLAYHSHPRAGSSEFIYLNSLRHFAPGLSLDQRDLLGESIVGLAREPQTDNAHESVLISPTGTRLILPDELTIDAANALASYLELKEELKNELVMTLAGPTRPQNRDELQKLTVRLRVIQEPKFEALAQKFSQFVLTANESSLLSDQNRSETLGQASNSPLTDLETLARLSSSQRRLLAYSYVSR